MPAARRFPPICPPRRPISAMTRDTSGSIDTGAAIVSETISVERRSPSLRIRLGILPAWHAPTPSVNPVEFQSSALPSLHSLNDTRSPQQGFGSLRQVVLIGVSSRPNDNGAFRIRSSGRKPSDSLKWSRFDAGGYFPPCSRLAFTGSWREHIANDRERPSRTRRR
jgi:hypothetical protein